MISGVLNWSAVRGSNTDFNANSRATQGGCGFASVASVRILLSRVPIMLC